MKLITEHTQDVQYLTESAADGKKTFFIEGIFMQAEIENRNKRIYPRPILESAVGTYVTEQVAKGRAVGELNHPQGPSINLDKVSHKITELRWDNNDVYGKAQILNTPMGQIVEGLIDGGVQLGVSSRGMGGVSEKKGKTYVQEGFILSAVDIVQDPSAQSAFVNGIMEGVEFIVTDDGHIEEYLDNMKKRIRKTPSNQLAEQQVKEWNNFLTMLRG
jgi:hypothetical protein